MYLVNSLSFSFCDLEPFIDTHTMGLHYEKHQKNYLNELNKLLMKNDFDYSYPIEDLYFHIQDFPLQDQENLLFYLGGVVNHNLYWKSISPEKKEKPNLKFMKKIQESFGTFSQMQKKILLSALTLKGSGYVFLVLDSSQKMALRVLPNQESPLAFGEIPLLCLDLWEHAYYLNYGSNKKKYIESFLEIANYAYANQFFP